MRLRTILILLIALMLVSHVGATSYLDGYSTIRSLLNFNSSTLTFDDASVTSWTSSGVTQSTTVYKFGGSSAYIGTNSSTNWIYGNGSSALAFGSGNFTLLLWLNMTSPTSAGNGAVVYDSRPASTQGVYPMLYIYPTTRYLSYYVSTGDRITGSYTLPLNSWHQVIIQRVSGSTKMYVDGVQNGSTYTDSNNYLNGASRPVIGNNGIRATPESTNGFPGYVDSFVVWTGTNSAIPISELYPQPYEVGQPGPVAAFSGTPTSGNVPLSVTFTDTSTNSPPSSWLWDFGDGNTTGNTTQNPVHLYTANGTYNVSLRATNVLGSDWENKTGYIVVGSTSFTPLAMFTRNYWLVLFPRPIQFNDTSTNTPTSWNWSFGDGKYSNDQNPAHQYVKRGRWTVALNASNGAGYNINTSMVWILGG